MSGAQQAIAIPGSGVISPPVSSHDERATVHARISEDFAAEFRSRLLRRSDVDDNYQSTRLTGEMNDIGKQRPRLAMLFIWQMPLMLFAYSSAFFFAGLSSVVISPLVAEGGKWGDEAKTVVVYLAAVVVSFVAFTSTSWGLYCSALRMGNGTVEK